MDPSQSNQMVDANYLPASKGLRFTLGLMSEGLAFDRRSLGLVGRGFGFGIWGLGLRVRA